MSLTLVIGNKNYSSWSMRPWLALTQLGVPFEEIVVPLDQPESKAAIARHSPSGRVPVLRDGDVTVPESIAILEYLAEQHPLLPKDRAARAHCRAVSAEMHAGFATMRENMPMDIRGRKPGQGMTPAVAADIARIRAIWRECLSASGGPLLFGDFSMADCMYAPVVTRFRTYGVGLDGPEAAFADAVWRLPAMQKWVADAEAEQLRMKRYET